MLAPIASVGRSTASPQVVSPYLVSSAASSPPLDSVATLPVAETAAVDDDAEEPSSLAATIATTALLVAGALSSSAGLMAPAIYAFTAPDSSISQTAEQGSRDVHIISNVDATEGVIEPFATDDLRQLQGATAKDGLHVTVDVAIEREAHPTRKLLVGGAVVAATVAPLGIAIHYARKSKGTAAAIAIGLAGLAGEYAVGQGLNEMHDGVGNIVSALADKNSPEGVWSGRREIHMADGKRESGAESPDARVDPREISDFIASRMKQYPSSGTTVVHLVGHGLMYRHISGINGDAFPWMIADAASKTGRPIDVLVLESCLSSNLETLNSIYPHVRYAVVSEESIAAGVVGPTFENTATKIAGQSLTPRDLSTAMLSTARGNRGAPTLAVIDMQQIPQLVSSVDQLGADLAAEVKDGRTDAIQRALDGTEVYPQEQLATAQKLAVGDLKQFAQKLQAQYKDASSPRAAAVRDDAGKVLEALQKATVGLNLSSAYATSGGVSIQLPGMQVQDLENKADVLGARGFSSYAKAASPEHWRAFVDGMSGVEASKTAAGSSSHMDVVAR